MTADAEIVAFMVKLYVGAEPALFLALSADGAVNRSGSGRPNTEENDVFIGVAPGPFFEQAMEFFDIEWLYRCGTYEIPDQLGERCVLTLTFFLAHQPPDAAVLEFRYGAKSQGPPPGVQEFVRRAVAVTQEWYAERLAEVADSGR